MANARKTANASANTSAVNVNLAKVRLIAAFADAAKSGVTIRKAIETALRMFNGNLETITSHQDACRLAYMSNELGISEARVTELRATENKDARPDGWKAADMRFRANWARGLKDAGLETTEARGGARDKKTTDAKEAAPVTVETMAIPVFATPADLQAFLVNVSTALNHMLSKNAKGEALKGDYGSIVRDAVTSFGAAVRRPL